MKKITGWWFAPADNKLANGDGRRIRVGITHKIDGDIVPCQHGLHLSKRAIDALEYAPGPIVYRVEGSGAIIPHGDPVDKFACSERTYVAGGIDCTEVLRRFARTCALDVVHLWDAPDIVVQYLETGDESLRVAAWDAARDAARDAAGNAAWDAAWAAARAAAWDDAWDAAWDTAGNAAGNAARAAAWDAAWDAAGNAARAAAWDAAWDAAGAAAWAAAWDATRERQNRRLTAMLSAAIKNGVPR